MKSEERIVKNTKKKKPLTRLFFLEAPPRFGLGIKVLQTSALPLGYGAVCSRPRATLFQCSDVPCHSAGHQYINRQPFGCPAYKNQRARILLRARDFFWSGLRGSNPPPRPWQGRALPNELTPHRWCLRSESNQRHGDFQSPALPTELQRRFY